MKVYSCSAKETEQIGEKFASELKGNEIIAFYGDLGAGKTTFVRGIANFFGIKDEVSSPTFSLVHEYHGKDIAIYHFDMYRIESVEDLESTGFFDYIDRGIILIEWSENIEKYLPEDIIKVTIEKVDEDSRAMEIEGVNFE